MIYLIIANLIISSFSLYISIRKLKYSEIKKIDPYKEYRDPKTGLLKSKKVNNL